MGKINGCLKCLFICFNTLFAIIGVPLISVAMRFSDDSLQIIGVPLISVAMQFSDDSLQIIGVPLISVAMQFSDDSLQISKVGGLNLLWIWFFVIGIFFLGIYAGFSEKEIVLKIFAGFMVVVLIIMLIPGIVMVVKRNKIKSSFDSTATQLAKSLKEDEKLRKKLDGLQQTGQCCGVVSASDWGDNIPSSCKCSGDGGYGGYGGSECTSKPQGVSGPHRIYAQPCSEVMFVWIDLFFKIAMGMCFGFAIFPLLGLLLSLLMICQVRHHDGLGGTSIAMRGY